MRGRGLIIFDCDGVLVDSEPVSIAVLTGFLRGLGLAIDEPTAYRRFLGRSWPTVAAILAADYGRPIVESERAMLRAEIARRFRSEIRPVPGIVAALDRLDRPACVASSSDPDRLALTLRTAGLEERFAPHVFSAAEVARGKPAPDLFLHAAARMGVPPTDCLVVEDSPAGVEAARAAGMAVIGFLGGGHVEAGGLAAALEVAGPDAIVRRAGDLPGAIAAWDARRHSMPSTRGSQSEISGT